LSMPQQRDITPELRVRAVLLEMPRKIQAVQRRAAYRVTIGRESNVTMRAWRLAPAEYVKAQPPTTRELPIELKNLGAGGAGVRFRPINSSPPIIAVNERLRIQIIWGDEKLVIEGSLRGATHAQPDGSVCTGIQFKKLDNDLEGRKTNSSLARIV